MTLSLRNRIWMWSAGSMLAVLFVFAVVADNSFRSTIVRELETNARSVARLAADQHVRSLQDFTARSMLLAHDAQLVAAVSTDDSTTVQGFLDAARPTMDVDWLAVTRLDGTPLTATDGATLDQLPSAENLIHDARFYDTGDVWVDSDGLKHVAAGPVLRGDQPLAILLAGKRVDASQVTTMEAVLQQRVALIAGDEVVASDASSAAALTGVASAIAGAGVVGAGSRSANTPEPAPPSAANDTATRGSPAPPMAPVQTFSLGRERFIGLTEPIVNANGDPVASILAFRSLDDALAPARSLRLTLLAVAGAGVAVAFLLGLALARTVTAPVDRLLEDAQRLGSGDLDHPVVPGRHDEIGALAEGFDQMRIHLKAAQDELVRGERLSAIGQMASSIVHDFSNPLVSIRLNADVLEMDGLSDDNLRSVHGIKDSVRRLNEMMRELLDFAGGKSSIDSASTDLGDWLEDLSQFWKANLGSMGVEFRVDAEYRDSWNLDRARLRRVIDNLIKNAQGAVRPGGAITLRTSLDSSGLRLQVEDTGSGIPPHLHETLFQPFVTYGKKEGTGLGLAICKNIVERHGGVIDFTSSSRGTTFTIVIPPAPAKNAEEATA